MYPTNGSLPVTMNFHYVPDVSFKEFKDGMFVSTGAKFLFPHLPKIQDVKQSNLEDCFLLASLLSIISCGANGAEFITKMMVVLPDNRVLIRFFNLKTNEPIFIALDRTFFSTDEEDGHSALWVFFIEKAYAAYMFLFRDVGKRFEKILFGGSALNVLKLVMGTDAERRYICGYKNYLRQPLIKIFLNDVHQPFPLPTNIFYWYKSVFNGIKQFFNSSSVVFKSDGAFAKALNVQLSEKTRKMAKIMFVDREQINQSCVVEFIIRFFPEKNKFLKKLLIEYVNKNFEGSCFFNQYTPTQLLEYEQIHEALKKNKLVVLGSKVQEKLCKGLYSGHDYAVINCGERGGIKYLVLIDPSQNYIPQYQKRTARFVNVDGGVYKSTVLKRSEIPMQLDRYVFFDHKLPIINSARPIPDDYWDMLLYKGVFELTLKDYLANFDWVVIAHDLTSISLNSF